MKPRDDRRRVMVMARMRSGAAWNDICILDMSSRGIGARASAPPAVGSYLEVRRGPNVIVARVMWARNQRFGAQSQDRLAIDAFVAEQAVQPGSGQGCSERRAVERTCAKRHEASRWIARATEFAGLVVAGLGAATIAYAAIQQALAKPLAAALAVLG